MKTSLSMDLLFEHFLTKIWKGESKFVEFGVEDDYGDIPD